jgi:hypothetical protein
MEPSVAEKIVKRIQNETGIYLNVKFPQEGNPKMFLEGYQNFLLFNTTRGDDSTPGHGWQGGDYVFAVRYNIKLILIAKRLSGNRWYVICYSTTPRNRFKDPTTHHPRPFVYEGLFKEEEKHCECLQTYIKNVYNKDDEKEPKCLLPNNCPLTVFFEMLDGGLLQNESTIRALEMKDFEQRFSEIEQEINKTAQRQLEEHKKRMLKFTSKKLSDFIGDQVTQTRKRMFEHLEESRNSRRNGDVTCAETFLDYLKGVEIDIEGRQGLVDDVSTANMEKRLQEVIDEIEKLELLRQDLETKLASKIKN